MTARDDQPATVPPPAGEDDAYSAATKVGAMPADVMEKLRAEGLLPEEPPAGEGDSAQRPSTSLEKRPTPVVEAPPGHGLDLGPIPTLYSNAPPPKIDSVKPDAMTGPPPAGGTIETPVAFAFPPVGDLPKLAAAAEEAEDGAAREEKTGAALARAKNKAPAGPSQRTLYAVAAFVVIALIVALIRLAG